MIPKISGWSVLVQFARYRTTLTSLGCAAQLSTNRIICLICAPICASKEWRNEQTISVVIHALPFAWYLVGNFLLFLKYLGFGDFPFTIGTCLSLPSLLTLQRGVTSAACHSENVICRGVTSTARHAALSHSFDYISTT
jgi:hypothetical protein